MNKSITTLPADKQDLPSLHSCVQKMLDSLNQLAGVNERTGTAKLSSLETEVKEQDLSVPAIYQRLIAERDNLQNSIDELTKVIKELTLDLEELEKVDDFKPWANNDLNNADWGIANGNYFGSMLGSAIVNPPTGAGLIAGDTYFVVMYIATKGAFTQTLHITKTGFNKAYKRSGPDLATAITYNWLAI